MAALAMVALLSMVALVLNLGFIVVERRRLQNAADAIALAATWRVLDAAPSGVIDSAALRVEAQRLAGQNDVTIGPQRTLTLNYVQAGSVLATIDGSSHLPWPLTATTKAGVQVQLDSQVDTLLLGIVGLNPLVSAQSQAQIDLSTPSTTSPRLVR